MSAKIADRHFWSQSRSACGLLALACAAWSLVFVWQGRTAPARQHLEAGLTYDRQGRYDEATREWREAVRLDPNAVDAWKLIGYASISADRWSDATEAFRHVLRLKPNEPETYTSLATCTFRANDFTAAVRYAQEALKRNPDDTGALAIAAYCAPAVGDQTERLGYLRRLVKLLPNDVDYLLMLAQPLTTSLLFKEARPLVDRILALEPNNAQGYALRGFIYFTQSPSPQSLTAAEADLRRSLELNPLSPFALFHLGRVYKQEGRPAKAIPVLAQATQLAPDGYQTYYELAEAFEQVGDAKHATIARKQFERLRTQRDRESLLEKRVIALPNDFDSNLEYGLLLLETRDLQKAQVCLTKALGLRPADTRAKAAFHQLVVLGAASRLPASIPRGHNP